MSSDPEQFSQAYKRYALGTITLVLMLNSFDRGVMMLLLQPIKEDLHLSDTQLGFMTGIAVASFYAVLGVFIARWADRSNRVNIAAAAMGLWGLAVMACLVVTNFVQLVIVRVAAAVGESGGWPPMYSLLGDYFTKPEERTRSMYISQGASPLTALASFALAGWLNDLYGWRLTFFFVGIPGLVLALLIRGTLVEPRTRAPSAPGPMPPLKSVWAVLWGTPACRHLTIAMTLVFTTGQGLGSWFAAFMIRSHGMSTAQLGVWFGVIIGIGGLAGLIAGEFVIRRWFARNEQGQVRIAGMAVASTIIFYGVFLLARDQHYALLALLPQTIALNAFLPIPLVLLQRLVPDDMRATVMMVMMLLANLIGMGVGPQVVGIISDALAPQVGSDSLRYAMLLMSSLIVWAGYHFWRVGRTIGADLASAATQRSAPGAASSDQRATRAGEVVAGLE